MSRQTLSIIRLQYLQSKAQGATQTIATYILDHLQDVSAMTIAGIAEETHTSYATVCRFLKTAGANGLRDFRKILSKEAIQEHIPSPLELGLDAHEDLSVQQINQRIRDFSIGIIENCCATMTPQLVALLIRVLCEAKSIYFIGLGTSAITAQYAYTKFFRIFNACAFDTDMIVAKMKASLMQPGHVLFAVSSSGRTKNILDIARTAKENGATVISLCDFANSPLANASDISICTTIRESNKYIDMDFPLIQGQITIIDVLYASLYTSIKPRAEANLQKTTDAAAKEKERTV